MPAPDRSFRWRLLAVAVLNGLVCILFEDFGIEVLLQRVSSRFESKTKTLYGQIERWLQQNPDWPPLSEAMMATAASSASLAARHNLEVTAEVIGEDDHIQVGRRHFDLGLQEDRGSRDNGVAILNRADDAVS